MCIIFILAALILYLPSFHVQVVVIKVSLVFTMITVKIYALILMPKILYAMILKLPI